MTPGEITPAEQLRGKILIHLEEIETQRDSFDRVAMRLGRDGFVAAWSRTGSSDQIDAKGSLERAYEQVVNDLVAMFDRVEAFAAIAGVVPDPAPIAIADPASAAAVEWWGEAERLGVDTTSSDRSLPPGRWRRLALYGHLDHDIVAPLVAWSNTRNLFQHGYAHRNRDRAVQVWDAMEAFRSRLPEVIEGVVAFRDRVAGTSDL